MYNYESKLQIVTDRIMNPETGAMMQEYKTIPELPTVLNFIASVLPGVMQTNGVDKAVDVSFGLLVRALKKYEAEFATSATPSPDLLKQLAEQAAAGQLALDADGKLVAKESVTLTEAQATDPEASKN